MTDAEFLKALGISAESAPDEDEAREREDLRLKAEYLEAELAREQQAARDAWRIVRAVVTRHYGDLTGAQFRALMCDLGVWP